MTPHWEVGLIYRSIVYLGVVTVVYALLSRRLGRSPITGPMYFVTAGLLGATVGAWDPLLRGAGASTVLEVTLGLVLFTEAMKLRLVSWTEDFELATRLLGIGMPLTIGAGAIAAALIFPELGLIGGAVIATVLAPTDAALGLAVVQNPKVPRRIREALAVESGLNDGIALPVLLFFLAVFAAEEGTQLWSLFLEGVGVAVVVGVLFGLVAGFAMKIAAARGLMQEQWQQIMVVIVPLVSLFVADALNGSGFIATFVAGLAFGRLVQGMDRSIAGFADDLGTALTMLAFALFGGIILANNIDAFTVSTIVYAVLSLTVVRMIPVALSVIGTGIRSPTVVFLGWFGPRGLASIIFAAVVVEEAGLGLGDPVLSVMVVTVTLSVFAHGATAYHGAHTYAAWSDSTVPP
ncbi:MAG: cation:proton antiporter [Acidimicrobiia bacterium]|nr:MAG: cation:proton antiporter [Acidimicrobiia bacterium]